MSKILSFIESQGSKKQDGDGSDRKVCSVNEKCCTEL